MIKIAVFFLVLLSARPIGASIFDPLDAESICLAYSSNPKDKYAQLPGSEMIYYNSTSYIPMQVNRHFVVHQGRCGHVYCPAEYACICGSDSEVYYNGCHMRSLGVFRGFACTCPTEGSDGIISNPDAKSNKAIKDYYASQKINAGSN